MITPEQIDKAATVLKDIVEHTPLQFNKRLSKKYNAKIYMKREDLQIVRSFKIRGAYYKISLLTDEQKKQGVVCASAGNHSQGVAFACNNLKIHGTIFMPVVTPKQKVNKVKLHGDGYVTIKLVGNNFDEAFDASQKYCNKKNAIYVHPFDDEEVITGQATVGKEIYEELKNKIDMVVTCEGGGGLTAGICSYLAAVSPDTQIIACEPAGAAGLATSRKAGHPVVLDAVDTFVDGAAVKSVGVLPYKIMEKHVQQVVSVPEGQVATTMIELYQYDGIIAEPAGALAIAGLEMMEKKDLEGKTIVCTISGGNNDILRYPEVMERSLIYQGLKHYFIIEFTQKPGQLMKFLQEVLGPHDDIVLFEYMKKNNKEKGPALVGVELADKKDYDMLVKRFEDSGLEHKEITANDMIYRYLI